MADSRFQQLREQLDSAGRGEIIGTLAEAADGGNSHASAFLEELEQVLLGLRNIGDIWRQFTALAEQHIYRRPQIAPPSGFVRVISAVDFLCYYSKKFIKVEEATRRGSVRAEIGKIQAAFTMVTADNVKLFIDDILNLNGRLRRHGSPLWLTPDLDIVDCLTFANYVEKLALGDTTESPVRAVDEGKWVTPEQLENAAYLVVNLGSNEALQKLVAKTSALKSIAGDLIAVVIAAIRSFPEEEIDKDLFLPSLLRWLRVESVASLAFETLSDLVPHEAGAYLAALAYYHRDRPEVIRKALTHLYYRDGDTKQGMEAVSTVVESFESLTKTIQGHPFLPDAFKSDVRDTLKQDEPLQTSAPRLAFAALSQEKRARCQTAQETIQKKKSLWTIAEPV